MTAALGSDPVTSAILAEATCDFVSACELFSVAMEESGLTDPELARALAIGVAAELICAGLVEAGEFVEDEEGFQPWAGTPGDVVARITTEWLARDRPDVDFGEIMWLSATEAGAALVEYDTGLPASRWVVER